MNVFTANIKSNPLMRQSRVESDIEHAVHLGGVGFWQEIAPKRYKAALGCHATKAKARVYGIDAECPVTLADHWEMTSEATHLMHKGRLLVTPARKVVEVRCDPVLLAGGVEVKPCFMGTHMISSAWSTRHLGTRAWRRKMWYIHIAKLQTLILDAHDAGYTVFLGLDANHGIVSMKFHPDQVILSAHGIDGIICVPAQGLRVAARDERTTKGLFTDHDPVSVTAVLTKAS